MQKPAGDDLLCRPHCLIEPLSRNVCVKVGHEKVVLHVDPFIFLHFWVVVMYFWSFRMWRYKCGWCVKEHLPKVFVKNKLNLNTLT